MVIKDWYKLTFLIESDSEEIIIWKLNELGIFSFSFEYLIKNENKKEVNIETKRKSRSKIMIIEKPGATMPSGGMPSRGSGGSNIASAVNDEKILMKMQSTSTLKFT